jgi:hypothetical protein
MEGPRLRSQPRRGGQTQQRQRHKNCEARPPHHRAPRQRYLTCVKRILLSCIHCVRVWSVTMVFPTGGGYVDHNLSGRICENFPQLSRPRVVGVLAKSAPFPLPTFCSKPFLACRCNAHFPPVCPRKCGSIPAIDSRPSAAQSRQAFAALQKSAGLH